MKNSKQHTVDSRPGKKGNGNQNTENRRKIALVLAFFLYAVCCLLSTGFAEINNTLAYSVSHTGSSTANDLNPIGTNTICQTILATVDETWYGIVVYLDRQGLSSSGDSVLLRLRGNSGFEACNAPDTSLAPRRNVYVKFSDIPDGDGTRNTLPPDSVARGYAIWFIFSSPLTVSAGNCYNIFLNAYKADANNRINWFYGTNGYSSGTCYYASNENGPWTNYNSDMDFRVIKDKYALVAVRRFPFNLKGVLTINGDMDNISVDYMDSLHQWLNTSNNVGGSWGTGINTQIAGNELWFARASVADSLGVYSKEVPLYFHGLDTTSIFYKDSCDNYVSRRWADGNHSYVDCGWDGGSDPYCADSTSFKKFLNYMLNRSSTFGKLYKAGLWVHHGAQRINFGYAGGTSALGDSAQTVYYNSLHTLASGRFKFVWMASDLINPTSNHQLLTWKTWQDVQDSLNLKETIFANRTLRDNTKTYYYNRIGRNTIMEPDSLYKFFNQDIAKRCADSNWISVIYNHLGYNNGLDQDDRDSISAVVNNATTWGLWIPSTKALMNQQAASVFGQFTVDRPTGSKRRINIKSLHDWNWGSHIPDREEVYFLTFICYAPESLIITINGTDTLTDSNMTSQQDVATNYTSSSDQFRAMSWVGMYNRTAGRKTVIYTPPSAPPSGKRNRTAVIEHLLSSKQKTVDSERGGE